MSVAPVVSLKLDRALNALAGEIRDTDNPVGAARAVRRVAARFRLEHEGLSTAIESCTGLAIENCTLGGGDEPLVRRFLLCSCSLSLRG